MSKTQVIEFTEGLTVIIPRQFDGKKIKVKKRRFIKPENIKDVPDRFTFIRGIITIDLVDQNDEPVETYDPPIILLMDFDEEDVKSAKGKPIKFAYGKGEEWIPFKAKHQFKVHTQKFENWEGFGVAFVSDWTDPPIAVGR